MSLLATEFEFIRTVVRRESAIVLNDGQEYLVESRLGPLARELGATGISGIVAMLQRGERRVLDRVVDAMTTNETSFFRDVHPFDALRGTILPELLARRPGGVVSVWCGATSSGQEPYSLAMLLHELGATSSRILATDISDEMLGRTREGRYSQLEVNRGLPIASLVRHFDQDGREWRVKPPLRAMVETRKLNLNQPLPAIGPFDVVMLRNVLIYFDPPTKRAILGALRRVIRPDGYLFLGGAETTLSLDDGWERVLIDRAPAYRLREHNPD